MARIHGSLPLLPFTADTVVATTVLAALVFGRTCTLELVFHAARDWFS